MDADSKKPFKVKDVTRNIKKAVVASSLEEIRSKVAEKFEKSDELPTIHLDSDGTEIDDEEYFRTLDENTELIAVFPGEHWIDATKHVTITRHPERRSSADTTDAVAVETARLQQLVGQLKNNLCNVSVMSDPDLESLSNMDPNSLVDITGKDFMEQLKDSGRPLCAKRNAQDRINLLKLLRDGAIFCSERYPEDAEAIDLEISRQLNVDATVTAAIETQQQQQQKSTANSTLSTPAPMAPTAPTTPATPTASAGTTTTTTTTTTTNTKTIDEVQNSIGETKTRTESDTETDRGANTNPNTRTETSSAVTHTKSNDDV